MRGRREAEGQRGRGERRGEEQSSLPIHTTTNRKITASMSENAQGWTEPKAKGVNKMRTRIPPVTTRSQARRKKERGGDAIDAIDAIDANEI